LQVVILALLILALSPFVYYILCFYCVIASFRRLRQAPATNETFMPPASILKPVRGVDREAYENFASFCRLDYPEYELVFAVSDTEDPVISIIERLRADFPQRSIRLITSVPCLGANDKVNNLCELVHNARYEFIVMSDSDVRVDPDYLKKVFAPFADPRVGAVTALYKSLTAGNLASNLNALGMYMDSAPAALVAKKIEGKMRFAFGWTIATYKKHLAEVGGWEAMSNHHSDDFELGKRIAERGYRVELMRIPVSMVFPRETLGEYFRHELRWSVGLKSVRPLGYWGLIFTQGLPWALLGATAAWSIGSMVLAVSYLLAYSVLRVGLTWTTGTWGLGDRRLSKILWLVPVHDAIGFVVWVKGFFSDRITWRGLAYEVRNGQLFPIQFPNPKIMTREPVGTLPKLSHRQQDIPARPVQV
jgi:ceramide glucosyltransferase